MTVEGAYQDLAVDRPAVAEVCTAVRAPTVEDAVSVLCADGDEGVRADVDRVHIGIEIVGEGDLHPAELHVALLLVRGPS
jgi:hypothetical protein